jgi:hypothetical protein
MAGVVLLISGAALFSGVLVNAGASASTQKLKVSPASSLKTGKVVTVRGSGFVLGASGFVSECNDASNQSLSLNQSADDDHPLPIGCALPLAVTISTRGKLPPTKIDIETGNLGTWEIGTDLAGNPSAVDAGNFPCPPTAAQQTAGDSCDVEFFDNRGDLATHVVSFKSAGKHHPTTTTTSVPGTTTTTLPCLTQPVIATSGGASVTADPGTCLVDGTAVAVSANGLMPGSASNFLGTIVECNSDPNQPTVNILGTAIPVSCTGFLAHTFTPDTAGTNTATVDAVEGTTGPACAPSLCGSATDSSGGNPFADATNYPCPPTPAQAEVGDICDITLSDTGGDKVMVPISFDLNPGTTTTTTTTSTTSTTTIPTGPTTTLPCNQPESASALRGQGTATATPATCLVNGTPVAVTASELTPASSSNTLGTVVECNSDPNQPTVVIIGNTVPVSCTGVLVHTFTPNAAGTATMTFDAVEGTTGPACAPSLCTPTGKTLDSTGGNPFVDAANYPCPPTPAQAAAGDICFLRVGDNGGDQIQVPISF